MSDRVEKYKERCEMSNAYIGMYVSPEGLCSNTLAEVRSDAELSRIVDCKNCEVPKRYFELSKKYRETHKKDK